MGLHVILDCGHYKGVPGKRSPNWDKGVLYEWEYTRKIARALMDHLTALGISNECITLGEQDVSLSKRAAMVNEICKKKKSILISIHLNAGGGTGWEVFTTNAKTKSDDLAKCFCEVFSSVFPDQRLRGCKEENFTLLYMANCPAILTENFFMDFRADYELLNTEKEFQGVVELHVLAIQKYIEKYS